MKKFRNIRNKYECLDGTNAINKSKDKEYAADIIMKHRECRNYDDKGTKSQAHKP